MRKQLGIFLLVLTIAVGFSGAVSAVNCNNMTQTPSCGQWMNLCHSQWMNWMHMWWMNMMYMMQMWWMMMEGSMPMNMPTNMTM